MRSTAHAQHHGSGSSPYLKLAVMAAAMFLSMFALMYAMVDRLGDVYLNLNQGYMAGLMTGPMIPIELALMGAMYPNKRLNLALLAAAGLITAACWIGIREQAGIGDAQFLRSMIPHHGGAILMCQQAPVRDAQIKNLCAQIIASQEREIRDMKRMLGESGEAPATK